MSKVPTTPTATIGIDTLLASLDRHGVPPNDNVWVDTAAMWRQLLTQPDQAAHAMGKILSRVGPERVMWGTDSIWYGSPQPQIMAMRAFQITAEYQERYGYPALTDDIKAAVFGLNAAALFGIDPTATHCALATDPSDHEDPRDGRPARRRRSPSPWEPHGPTTRRQVLRGWRHRRRTGCRHGAMVRMAPSRRTSSSTVRWPWPPTSWSPPGPAPRAGSGGASSGCAGCWPASREPG